MAALTALCTIARLHHVAADPLVLLHALGMSPSQTLSVDDLLRAAQHLGLRAKLIKVGLDRLAHPPLARAGLAPARSRRG